MMEILNIITAALVVHIALGYPYSLSEDKRSNRVPFYGPAYIPLPLNYGSYQSQGYENQEDIPRFRRPYYYHPYRANSGPYPLEPSGTGEEPDYQFIYPYGQEMWYEGGQEAAANAAAATREAILQNLIIAQMYEDAAASAAVNGFPLYQMPNEEDNADYKYGVPITDIDEKEEARKYLLRNEAEEEVKELESLRKTKEASKQAKRRRKQKNRGNKEAQVREYLEVSKRSEITSTSRPPVLTEITLDKNAASLSPMTATGGQKEVVLPQPTRSRRPLPDLHQRLQVRREQPSPYQTIKQLLKQEGDYKTGGPRLQKRFISTEEQLTQQLNSLKRAAMSM